MSFQVTHLKEKKGEDDSMTWKAYAVEKLSDLESAIQDMVQQEDELPNQLLIIANAILKTLPGLNSLKNHKEDFERLLGQASTILVYLCQSYIAAKAKYRSQLSWPPPKLKEFLNELVDTTCCIRKLMGRKSQRNLAKRVILGCFGIRDLGKFNIYQRRLSSMALVLQSKPHNIDINAVLLAVVNSRAQVQDDDSELAGQLVEGDLPDKTCAKKKAVDKKPTAEGSRASEVGKSNTVKPVDQRVKSEEDSQRKFNKTTSEAKAIPKHKRDEERSAEDKSARRMDRRTIGNEEARGNQDESRTLSSEPDEADLVGCTSAQGSRSNDAAETPGPPSRHQSSISDFSFVNGSGIMINDNVGNIYNITRG